LTGKAEVAIEIIDGMRRSIPGGVASARVFQEDLVRSKSRMFCDRNKTTMMQNSIIGRDGAQIFVKSDKDTAPLPNPKRSPSMRWDAYV
jgi:hypothetical protein